MIEDDQPIIAAKFQAIRSEIAQKLRDIHDEVTGLSEATQRSRIVAKSALVNAITAVEFMEATKLQ